eukprot:5167152-Pyramimonas_sp.AAC.1
MSWCWRGGYGDAGRGEGGRSAGTSQPFTSGAARLTIPSKTKPCYLVCRCWLASRLDTVTVESAVKTLLSHLLTRQFNSPVVLLRMAYARVGPASGKLRAFRVRDP